MAYITAEQVKEKRQQIRKEFPSKDGFKFSVRKEHSSSLHIDILESPYDLARVREDGTKAESGSINHYYIKDHFEGHPAFDFLNRINEIAHEGHWDKSDTMTDYFHCAYYINIGYGRWDIPYKQTGSIQVEAQEVEQEEEVTYTELFDNLIG